MYLRIKLSFRNLLPVTEREEQKYISLVADSKHILGRALIINYITMCLKH